MSTPPDRHGLGSTVGPARGAGGGGAGVPRSVVLLGVWALVVLVAVIAAGSPSDPVGAVVLTLPQIPLWAAPAAAYLASGVGYGLLLSALSRGGRDRGAVVGAWALASVAMISQVAGTLGVLGTTAGAIGVLAPGWAVLLAWLWKRRAARVRIAAPSWGAWVGVVPLAVLVSAAGAPPGWLWESEYAGFDALSYHLTLPQEWLAAGRITGLEHNVYSFLPGSYESGVYHLAAMTGAPAGPVGVMERAGQGGAAGGFGLLAGDGWRLPAAQFLHASMAVLAAWLVGRAGRAAAMLGASAGEDDERTARAAGRLAALLTIGTAWCVVVGSLAYNEMGVLALGAGAMVAALDGALSPWRRGLLAGVLVGAACGFKPTAMTFFTPGVGLLLLAGTPARRWLAVVAAGALGGAAMLLPWMVRNYATCGNPVFPFASGLFGSGHWSAEQIARYASGHAFDGTLVDRLWLLVGPDPAAGPGARDVERWRGVFNPQYGVLFAAALGAIAAAVGGRRLAWPVRRGAMLLAGMVVMQGAAWVLTTHLQSRFLLPMVAPAAVLVGVALVGGGGGGLGARVRGAVGVALSAAQVVVLGVVYFGQRGGAPGDLTGVGPGAFTGRYEDRGQPSAAGVLNFDLPAGSRTYLLGDAAPLYLAGRGPRSVVWHTTWDASPLGDALRARAAMASGAAGEPLGHEALWTGVLRERGVTHVLVNQSELARYARSGWYDPEVTPERVASWLATMGPPLAVWERSGQALFAMPSGSGSASGGVGGGGA